MLHSNQVPTSMMNGIDEEIVSVASTSRRGSVITRNQPNNYLNVPSLHGQHTSTSSNVSFSSQHSKYSTTDITGSEVSMGIKLRNQLMDFIFFMQEDQLREGLYSYLIVLLFHIYIFWIGVFLPNLGIEMKNGEWGSWVFTVLNYPLTLSFERLPYAASIALACVVLAIELVFIVYFIWSVYAYKTTSQYLKWTKKGLALGSKLFLLISLPSIYLLTTPLDCNLDNSILNRFFQYSNQTIQCYSPINIAFMAIMIVGVIIQMILSIFSLLIVTNCHPQHFSPFISDHPFFLIGAVICTQLQILAHYVIPPQYSFVRSIVHLIFSISLMIGFSKNVPYFRRFENSIMVGVLSARIFSSFGSLITSIVNNPSLSGIYKSVDNILGIGLTGMTLCMIIISFLVGVVVMEIITRIVIRSVRFIVVDGIKSESGNGLPDLIEKAIEKDSVNIYQYLSESKKLNYLKLFLKFSVKENIPTEEDDSAIASNVHLLSNLKISLSLVRGLSSLSTQLDNDVLLLSSSLAANCLVNDVNATTFSKGILRRAIKKRPNTWHRFLIYLKQKEVDIIIHQINPNSKNTEEMSEVMHILEKRQNELKALHRMFWKEMLQECVLREKIEAIIVRMGIISSECETKFLNMLSIYKNDKNLIRNFAKYIEEFKFNKDAAQELYAEALSLEEEESKRNAQLRKRKRNQKSKLGKNRILPTQEGANIGIHLQEHDIRSECSSFYGDQKEAETIPDQQFNGIENNPEFRKENVYRTSLGLSHSHSLQLFLFSLFVLFSLLFLSASLALSVSFSSYIAGTVTIVEKSCAPVGVSVRVMSNLRAMQAITYVHNHSASAWTSVMSKYGYTSLEHYKEEMIEDITSYRDILKAVRDLVHDGSFTQEMYTEYHEVYYPFYMPTSWPSKEIDKVYNISVMSNSSIADITNLLYTHSETISNFGEEELKLFLSSYPFMILYFNAENMVSSFADFCVNFVSSSKHETQLITNSFIIYYSIIVSVYFIYTALYVFYSKLDLSVIKKIILLIEKNVSKNDAGRLFHELSKVVSDDTTTHPVNSVWKYPRSVVVALILILCLIVSVCCGLFLMETLQNVNKSYDSYIIMKETFQTIEDVQHLLNFITEKYIISGFPSNDDAYFRVSNLYNLSNNPTSYVNEKSNSLKRHWNLCIYGTSSGDIQENTILGKFDDVDLLVAGHDNCTIVHMFMEDGNSSCTMGIDNMVTNLVTISNEIIEQMDENTKINTLQLFETFVKHLHLSKAISDQMIDFSLVFSKDASITEEELVYTFSIVGFLSIITISLTIHWSLHQHFNSVQQIRLLFNYLSIDLMDSNENIKNYIIHHHIPNSLSSLIKKKGSSSEGDSKVRSILNASVDGAVMCSGEKVDIEIFNPAAQKIFGYNQTETIGRSLYQLFEKNEQSKIKKLVDEMLVNAARGDSKGDSIELECIRKNQTTFPSRVNIFVTIHNSQSVVTCFIKDITTEKKHNSLLAEEKKHSEELLLNILPSAVASKLKSGETYIAEKFNDITCFFSDMVGFTKLSSGIQASELVQMLNEIVIGFDDLTDKYNLEKIKTIGDSYFCVGGLHGLNAQSDHPERILRFSIDTFDVLQRFNAKTGKHPSEQINIRVGINTGSVVAGVIGRKKFAYDLWGDTINTSSRMESNSLPGRIQISRSSYERVYDLGFTFEERHLNVKGKGECIAYMLDEKHHSPALVPSFTDMLRTSLNILQKRSSANLERTASSEILDNQFTNNGENITIAVNRELEE